MDQANRKDLEAIEQLHRRDVAAVKAGDFQTLMSLMDEQCVVFPAEGEPESGQSYLSRVHLSSDSTEPQPHILELVQDWEEVRLLGDFAYEQGVVRYAVQDANGATTRETQRLMRLLRHQPDGVCRVFRAMWHAPRRAPTDTDTPSLLSILAIPVAEMVTFGLLKTSSSLPSKWSASKTPGSDR